MIRDKEHRNPDPNKRGVKPARNVFDNRDAAQAYLKKVGSGYEIVIWHCRDGMRWSVVGKPRNK